MIAMRKMICMCLLLTACNPKEVDKQPAIDSLVHNIKKPESIILLEGENFMVWGDDTISYESIHQAEVKFEPYISFRDFEVQKMFKGKKAPLQLKKGDEYWSYRTRIRNAYKEPVNFAGHYCFVSWGCGSPCQASAIIDTKTGKVYAGPSAALGYEYLHNSRMVIVNPPLRKDVENSFYGSKAGYYRVACAYCHPYIYIWNEKLKKFEERKPMAY